jgi:hypothetical protein
MHCQVYCKVVFQQSWSAHFMTSDIVRIKRFLVFWAHPSCPCNFWRHSVHHKTWATDMTEIALGHIFGVPFRFLQWILHDFKVLTYQQNTIMCNAWNWVYSVLEMCTFYPKTILLWFSVVFKFRNCLLYQEPLQHLVPNWLWVTVLHQLQFCYRYCFKHCRSTCTTWGLQGWLHLL